MNRAACLTVVAVVAAAGCGGSGGQARLTRSQYEARLESALAAGGPPISTPVDPAAASLGGVATRFEDVASRLSGLRAPADVQALNDRLVAGAAKAAASLRALLKRLHGAPVARRDRLLAEFDASRIPGLDQFNSAEAGLAAKGYRFSST